MALNYNATTGLRLLRLFPALTSTTLLMFAFDEHHFLSPFASPTLLQRSNAFLPDYFQRWLRRGKWVIILGYPATFLGAAANLGIARESTTATKLYATGLLFNLAHIMVFGPRMLGLLEDIKEGVPQGNVVESLRTWLGINEVRAWTTDFPAWVCFVAAVVECL